MAQLNINKLYETARKKELSKYENFDKILTRCHNKITHYAENKKTECLYNVPEFIIGTPLFDRNELQFGEGCGTNIQQQRAQPHY